MEEVEYDGECYRRSDPSKKISIGALARGYMFENGLTVGVPVHTTGSYRVQGVTEPDPESGIGNAAGSWTFGCQAAEIRIEKASGKVEVLHFASAFDPGKVVNPQMCRGQVTGGVVQGMGATLMEKIEFKKDGTIKNSQFGPYSIPRIKDMPGKFTVNSLKNRTKKGPGVPNR